ncbi:hypothetical protein PCE31106_02932 [Pandoraea cepalis]|uniref:Transmembrane protein n=2 Tax=Pandoraea cepalis TaxID=2508294 RepID=A0A5E4W059_9BURK|nr:hypothetical protein PCE31106_02932 [Pandoraea cepalis]
MPIDFNRVPCRVPIPETKSLSALTFIALLAVTLGVAAGLTFTFWSASASTNAAWFWICAVGFPVLAWAFICCSWLGYLDVKRSDAIAHNRACNDVEMACHTAASAPLTVLGQAWCFSSEPSHAQVSCLHDGTVKREGRPSAVQADRVVDARWIAIPGRPFAAGNEENEHARHKALLEWLYGRLFERIGAALRSLPVGSSLDVLVHVSSSTKLEWAVQLLEQRICDLRPDLQLLVTPSREAIPLFQIDAWLDETAPPFARLVVSVQLLDAISQELSDGVAEAGVALLFGPSRGKRQASTLFAHRPAAGTSRDASTIITLACRWGLCDAEAPLSIWMHGIPESRRASIKRWASSRPTDCHALEDSVGDCATTGAWLALAVALESVEQNTLPNLVMCVHHDQLVALVCRNNQ